MIFRETGLPGAFVMELERCEDERGFFARTYCQREFQDHGVDLTFVQCNIAVNAKRGTLRGMHYQVAPHGTTKLVRCTGGSIYDVIIDLRPESETFRKHFAVVLTAENRNMVYVPPGFAHGYQTLEDETEVFYQMSEFYDPESERGMRWDDPSFGISWPLEVTVMSTRDRGCPDFSGGEE